MFRKKRQNTRYAREHSDRVLHLKVNSPRIVFFQSVRATKGILKFIVIVGILGFASFYGIRYLKQHFLTHDDFALRFLDLETNGSLTVNQVAEIAGISPEGTVFSFDIDEAQLKLSSRPEIVTATVERRLPDTVVVHIEERVPVAWLSCEDLSPLEGRMQHGLLVDAEGVVFRCQGERLWEQARKLPLITLPEGQLNEFPLGEKVGHSEVLRALALINLIRVQADDTWSAERVKIVNFYSLELMTSGKVKAIFGMYEHERQLHNLLDAKKHARESNRELEWINLIPKHNIPGRFKQEEKSALDESFISVSE